MLREVSDIIHQWKEEAGLKQNDIVMISAYPREIVNICTSKPGLMIGLKGKLVDKYKERLKRFYPDLKYIEFIETDHWYIR
ncbi:MAG: hypothetical protein ACLTWK_00285 [Eisenbergiella sp.]